MVGRKQLQKNRFQPLLSRLRHEYILIGLFWVRLQHVDWTPTQVRAFGQARHVHAKPCRLDQLDLAITEYETMTP